MSGNEPTIVRSTRKAGDPLSAEALAELDSLQTRSDGDIDFSDIPPSPPGFWRAARARRAQRDSREIQKAS